LVAVDVDVDPEERLEDLLTVSRKSCGNGTLGSDGKTFSLLMNFSVQSITFLMYSLAEIIVGFLSR
jgi:hypothetical protein